MMKSKSWAGYLRGKLRMGLLVMQARIIPAQPSAAPCMAAAHMSHITHDMLPVCDAHTGMQSARLAALTGG